MATNLYETLGVQRNATTEEIRRAYRRKALETHPDRLPQGASVAEKSASEDMFRKVNNAYEVLSDAQKRAIYDRHGVWPAPTAPQGPSVNASRSPFSDPFFQGPFFDPRMEQFVLGGFGPRFGAPRGFTDPFVLFNSIFGDFQRAFEHDPFFDDQRPSFFSGPFDRRGFGSSPFGGGFFGNGLPPSFPAPIDFLQNGTGGTSNTRVQAFNGTNNNGRWVSESWSTNTINGVTHTKGVRRDSEGNEHVTYRLPDGTERYTINGIEQPSSQSQRALPQSGTTALSLPYTSHPSRSSRYHDHPDYHGERRERDGRHLDRQRAKDHAQEPREGGSSSKFWSS